MSSQMEIAMFEELRDLAEEKARLDDQVKEIDVEIAKTQRKEELLRALLALESEPIQATRLLGQTGDF